MGWIKTLTMLAIMILTTANLHADVLSIPVDLLKRQAFRVILSTPCNWDRNVSNLPTIASYNVPTIDAGLQVPAENTMIEVPVTPLAATRQGDRLQLSFDPMIIDRQGAIGNQNLTLHHINVEIGTIEKVCKDGFGFKDGNFTK